MPTFTAIAFDRLIEPGASKSMETVRDSPDRKLDRRHSYASLRKDGPRVSPPPKLERGVSVPPKQRLERGVSLPPKQKLEKGVGLHPARGIPSIPNDRRRNGGPTAAARPVSDKKHHWTQISPRLYATPESTPLPDSPSSFPPSPYIINHKRRGPRLMKSSSEMDVATCKKAVDEVEVDENGSVAGKEVGAGLVSKDDSFVPTKVLDSTMDDEIKPSRESYVNGTHDMEVSPSMKNGVWKNVSFSSQQDSEVEDFVDPPDSASFKSIGESESIGGAERSLSSATPVAEFYDAWEELLSENVPQPPAHDIESELHEIRLSLLMEIEKRKQAEETLSNLQNQWQRIREQLSVVGLTLPLDPTSLQEDEQSGDNPASEICQQVYLARFVSNSIGRGIAKAEAEMEMEAQIDIKNFEIARLLDKLRYYEAVNQEMSQRNQEVVETARRLRQRRKRRQKWIVGSIATAVTFGSAFLAYSYFRSGKGGSSPPTQSHIPEVNHKSK